jgi:hypothetical protein
MVNFSDRAHGAAGDAGMDSPALPMTKATCPKGTGNLIATTKYDNKNRLRKTPAATVPPNQRQHSRSHIENFALSSRCSSTLTTHPVQGRPTFLPTSGIMTNQC